MSGLFRIDLGRPVILTFCGPDAVRFLNGQVTQDVRLLAGGKNVLPSCVTDAKGRLQFRVSVAEVNGSLWVCGPAEQAAELEARITRYLIADDVETADLTGKWRLVHFTGTVSEVPLAVISRVSNRYGVVGTDWFFPSEPEIQFPDEFTPLDGDALEAYRISMEIPVWGRELTAGMMLPEARLDETDISYQKGCYVGQEVISRIKSAGKVNRRLSRFLLAPGTPAKVGILVNEAGAPSGEITSVSPQAHDGMREALGFVKRGATSLFLVSPDGEKFPVDPV